MTAGHDTRRFFRQLLRLRAQRWGWQFAVLVTHWFYFSNHTYPGDHRYFIRIGDWRKNFGGVRRG